MRFKLIKLRFRRRLHQGELRAEDLSQQAEVGIERYIFRRFGRLYKVRRFISTWVILLVIATLATAGQAYFLSGYYQTLKPVAGGIYNEGVIGTLSTVNPIYAVSDVDTTISRLIFAPLFTYNSQNQLVGELASGYTTDSSGKVYTVHLKPGLTWQDGQPLTSKDVVFTYNLIENPNAQSPFFNSWQGVQVQADGPLTVTFTLPNTLSSFPQQLTNGILPEHLLANIPATEMRSAPFNSSDPIGSGPFRWQDLSVNGNNPNNAEEQVDLVPFDNFVNGQPKLDEFVVHAYADQSELTSAFSSGQLSAAEGLDEVPASIAHMSNLQIHNLILTAGVYTFFKTSTGPLANQSVRSALTQAVNVPAVIDSLGYATHAVNEPLLEGQLGYNSGDREPGYNLAAAEQTLTQAGWIMKGNVRENNGQPLTLSLTVSDSSEYLKVASELKSYWQKLGVDVNLIVEDPSDFSNILQSHNYQAILYGISIGVDPDVFVYWDSSQAQANSSTYLNLSEWKNSSADESLQEGRTSLDPSLRAVEYQGLLSAWQQNLPALGLYQPRLLYLTNGQVFGLNDNTINTNTDRFDNVWNWEINEAKVTD